MAKRLEPAEVYACFRTYYDSIDGGGAEKSVVHARRTKPILSFCKSMHRTRDFSELPDLARLLREAGCRDYVILLRCEGAERRHI